MRRRHSRLSVVKLAALPLVVLLAAAGVLSWALGSPLGGSSAAQATGPSITVTKECSLSPGGPFVGEFTFTFTITNDGDTPLYRYKAWDSTLKDMFWQFPETLAVGQTETVTLTKTQFPGDGECNWAEIVYRTESWELTPHARPECCVGPTPTPPPPGSVTLTKFKEVGPFTKPTLVCFRLDPVAIEQCKVPDATGRATFTWTDLPFGDYVIVETREVCTVKGVVEEPCTRYALLPPIPVTISESTPNVVLPEARNELFPGKLCVEKLNKDGNPWAVPDPDVTFTVTSETNPAFPPITIVIPRDGNPVCKLVPEGTYEICETPPPSHTVQPSVCQTVDILAGGPVAVTVTFKNTPTGEGCTPGFWKQKQHLPRWREAGINPDADFDTFFGVNAFAPDKTLFQAVNIKGKMGDALLILVPHLVAAVLNANHPDVDYAFTQADIIAWFQGAFSNDAAMVDLKNKLAAENEAGCPLD